MLVNRSRVGAVDVQETAQRRRGGGGQAHLLVAAEPVLGPSTQGYCCVAGTGAGGGEIGRFSCSQSNNTWACGEN